jgi:YVTN family beta-propeller protein
VSAVLICSAVIAGSGAAARPLTTVKVRHTYVVPGATFNVVAVDSRTHLAYIANGTPSGTLSEVINTQTGHSTTLHTPVWTQSIAIDQSTGLVYLPDYNTNNVTVMKGTTVVKTIHLAKESRPFDATINPVTRLVYVDEEGISKVAVIKGTKVDGSITVQSEPMSGAVDTSNGDVYIPNFGSDSVSVIRNKTVLKTIPVGQEPEDVAVDPSRHLAYVTSQGSESISILHGSSLQHTVNLGGQLTFGVAVDPVTHFAYIGGYFGALTILDGPNVKLATTIGELPLVPVYDPTNGLVIFPAEDAPQITVFQGINVLQTFTGNPIEAGYAGVDTSNGRAFVSGYHGDSVVELQTPAPGSITITRPTHQHYRKGSTVRVKFSCTAGADNTVTHCTGTTATGHLLSTSALGTHHFTVVLRAAFGPAIKKTVTYHVVKS